jgi:hypothetical protein
MCNKKTKEKALKKTHKCALQMKKLKCKTDLKVQPMESSYYLE